MASPASNNDGTISEDDLLPVLSDDEDTEDANTSDESEIEGLAPKRTKNAWVTLMSADVDSLIRGGIVDDELLAEIG